MSEEFGGEEVSPTFENTLKSDLRDLAKYDEDDDTFPPREKLSEIASNMGDNMSLGQINKLAGKYALLLYVGEANRYLNNETYERRSYTHVPDPNQNRFDRLFNGTKRIKKYTSKTKQYGPPFTSINVSTPHASVGGSFNRSNPQMMALETLEDARRKRSFGLLADAVTNELEPLIDEVTKLRNQVDEKKRTESK